MESLEQQWNKTILSLNLNQSKEPLKGLIQTTKAWSVVINWLNPSKDTIDQQIPSDVNQSLQILVQTPLANRLIEWYLDAVCRDFRKCFDKELHKWREDWVQLQKDNINSSNNDQVFEDWICKSYKYFIHKIHSHFIKCRHPLILMIASDEYMKEFRIHRLLTWSKRLNYHFCKVFCDSRISELFDVIVDFPDSKIAIDDLIVCMKRLDKDYRHRLVESLHTAFRKRLLIPGAGTMDIINTYISTIKCLRLLDSSGVLLEKITGPFKSYLRTREDAARCLVSSWMDDKNNNNELIEELGRTEEPIDNQQNVRFNDDNWLPDPMDAGPDYKSSIYRSADITNLLVSLFDTTELIIKEIQNQIASYLLTKTDYDTEKEITKLELFKLRFGESKMSTTEVMIKDIADSKRIDSFIRSNDNPLRRNVLESSSEEMILHGSIISRLFWPTLKDEDFDVPEQIADEMIKYNEGFQVFKPRRNLQWIKSLGKVQIELELQDRTLEFEVAPIYATIIHYFQQQDKWNLKDLAEKIKIDSIMLKSKMSFWSDRGILKELLNDEWLLLETAEEIDPSFVLNEENCDNIIQFTAEQKAEEFKMYWIYIENMLKNLGGMTLEKIHNILCSVAEPSSSNSRMDNNLEDLKIFLSQMVAEDKLEFQSGLYKVK
ncbi:hypothetical protein C1645_773520 [Glomus cerebriforme]|uniref:Anaphase-promoting complex subunit 2 n=1 Tax=Glomus cerebriforme TaxID=658196 RepID=A0A397SS87_9GLOM|nr:hypothetical protein C1645_773520 [Glomus cerebriforme]